MNIPKYVWISMIVLLSINELRLIYDTYKSYEDDDDKNKNELSDAIKHIYC